MTKTEILFTMLVHPPRQLFHTMSLGGNMAQLSKMEAEGLICSQPRDRQRDWYLSNEQHAAGTFLFDNPETPTA